MASFQHQNRSYGGDRVLPPLTPAKGPTLGTCSSTESLALTPQTTYINKENIMDENNRPLTAKQQQFCREYLIDMNAAAAARRAGYSEHTSEQQGSRLLRNVEVFAEIQRLIDERAERVEVDADYVVEKLRTMVEDRKCPASSQVQALGLLGKHLGMFTDKLDINDQRETITIVLEQPTPLLTLPDESKKAASHALGDSTGHQEGSKS